MAPGLANQRMLDEQGRTIRCMEVGPTRGANEESNTSRRRATSGPQTTALQNHHRSLNQGTGAGRR
jgi:hypothetical protein